MFGQPFFRLLSCDIVRSGVLYRDVCGRPFGSGRFVRGRPFGSGRFVRGRLFGRACRVRVPVRVGPFRVRASVSFLLSCDHFSVGRAV